MDLRSGGPSHPPYTLPVLTAAFLGDSYAAGAYAGDVGDSNGRVFDVHQRHWGRRL